MKTRMRLTINDLQGHGADLRLAWQVKARLWASVPDGLEDIDSPLHGTHRDANGRAYFEFETSMPDHARDVLAEHGYADRVTLQEVPPQESGEACMNCGNVAGPTLPAVCPSCKFRDISPCPVCRHDVPRQKYLIVHGDLFTCPNCRSRVRLMFNDDMFAADGSLNSPLTLVEPAEPAHAV